MPTELSPVPQVLPQALARLGTTSPGLVAMYFPPDVPRPLLLALVFWANAVKTNPDGTPYSILVTKDSTLATTRAASAAYDACEAASSVEAVSVAEAIRYRQGDRLVVVSAESADLESFSGTFRTVIPASFPANEDSALDNVCKGSAKILAEIAGSSDPEAVQSVARTLYDVLGVVSDILSGAGDPRGSWSSRWYEIAMQGLDTLARALQQSPRTDAGRESFREFVQARAFASFGLPRPRGDESTYKRGTTGATLRAAIDEHWGSSGDAATAYEAIAASQSLNPIDWSTLDKGNLELGSPLQALQRSLTHSHDMAALEAFSQVDEISFSTPFPPESKLEILSDLGVSLALGPSPTSASNFCTSEYVGKSRLGTERLRVRLSIPGSTRAALTGGTARISVGASEFNYEQFAEDGVVEFYGYLTYATHREFERSRRFTIKVEFTDASAQPVTTRASAEVVVLPPTDTVGISYFRLSSSGAMQKRIYSLGPDSQDDSSDEFEDTYDSRSGLFVVFSTQSHPMAGKLTLLQSSAHPNTYSTVVPAGTSAEIHTGIYTFRLSPDSGSTPQFSPLRAAATKSFVSNEALPDEVLTDVRATFEEYFSITRAKGSMGSSLGHVFCEPDGPTDQPAADTDIHESGRVLIFGGSSTSFGPIVGYRDDPTQAFDRGVVSAFEDAFASIVDVLEGPESGEPWISRTSVASLWEANRPLLDRYLLAYVELVKEGESLSKKRNHLPQLVATFPFSLSVWNRGHCLGVLISPWHPLRLAWLASAESTLRQASDVAGLLGTLEGWRFPYMAGGEDRLKDLIAVPLDSGFEEIFAGWGLMVPLPAASGGESLQVPSTAAGTPLPGASASGLTASAVSSALNDFLRVYSYVPELTIDLSSSTPMERLTEVDDCIVQLLKQGLGTAHWLSGVKVLDSTNRLGAVPRRALQELGAAQRGTRLTWTRYDPDSTGLPAAMVRVQEDPLMTISSEGMPGREDSGVIGETPLKRFGVEIPLVEEDSAYLHPLLPLDAECRDPFLIALGQIESTVSQRGVRIAPRFRSEEEAARTAEWTVSGESLVSPAAIQEVLRNSGSLAGQVSGSQAGQMLWEWRPPLFGGLTDQTELERRGYLTLSRIPDTLTQRIEDKLPPSLPDSRRAATIQDLFATLGSRGVGLASLLAVGDKQASGAIGFYLALKLCEEAATPDRVRLVLPIDSCQRFLDVLSGDQPRQSRHRADLLMIDIAKTGVSFIPIEVKMYHLGNPQPTFPGPASEPVRMASEQASETRAQIQRMLKRRSRLENPADQLLWDNALASLLDAGLKLVPSTSSTPSWLPRQFRLVVSGGARLTATAGIAMIFYELRDRKAPAIATSAARPDNDPVEVLMATSTAVLDADQVPSPSAAKLFRAMVDRQASHPVDQDLGYTPNTNPAPPSPLPAQVDPGSSEPISPVPGLAGVSSVRPSKPDLVPERDVAPVPARGLPAALRDSVPELPAPARELPASHDGPGNPTTAPPKRPEPVDRPIPNGLRQQPLVGEPAIGDGVRFPVGAFESAVSVDDRPELWLGNTDLNQLNIGVVGDLGTGKTQLLKYLIAMIRRESGIVQGDPVDMLVFDYKRDFVDQEFIDAVGATVLRPRNIPINLFSVPPHADQLTKEEKIRSFGDVLSKIYGGIGPKQGLALHDAIRSIYDYGQTPTLEAIFDKYNEENSPDSVTAILDTFVRMEIFDDGSESAIPFSELIHGRVLVLNLADLSVDESTKTALVTLFLNLYYDYMIKLRKWPFTKGTPSIRHISSYVVVDEAVNIMERDFPVLRKLIREGREFGAGVILASQYLAHFKSKETNWLELLRSWFIHRVPSLPKRHLDELGLSRDLSDEEIARITRLPKFHSLFKSLDPRPRFIIDKPFYELLGETPRHRDENPLDGSDEKPQ